MKKKTGYPSIDQTHKDGQSYFKRNPIIPNMSVSEAIKALSLFYRKDLAIDCLDLTLSYDELINNTAIMAKAFKELGIKAGDIITVSMPNFYQAVATYLAANQIGAVTTFLNYYSSIDEIKRYLNLFESPLFINYNQSEEYNNDITKNTKVKNIITLNHQDLNSKTFAKNAQSLVGYQTNIDFKDLELISKYYHNPFNRLFGKKQDSLILFTSGTTGNPKSVVLTNENILASGIYMKNSCEIKAKPGEKCLVCVPFTYPYGFATSTLMSLLCGREAILAPTLSSDNIGYYMEKNPNIVFGSPALLELIKRNVSNDQDLSSINTFISGGDFLTPTKTEEGKAFFRKHGANVNICNGSGNAETCGASTNAVGIEPNVNSVGKILVGSNAIVINPETHTEQKYNEEGILCINGKHVFKEYFGEDELTKNSIIEFNNKKYFITGSMGYIDVDGYFYLTGRESRYYINSALNKIYCDHVQKIISAIGCVEDVAIVEKPSKEYLYTNKAFIVLKKGIHPADEIKNYIYSQCLQQIAIPGMNTFMQLKDYEIPSSIEFVDVLPRKKTSNKIDYDILKENAKQEFENELINGKTLKK